MLRHALRRAGAEVRSASSFVASACLLTGPTRSQAPRRATHALRWLSSGTDLKARFAELLPAEQARAARRNGHP